MRRQRTGLRALVVALAVTMGLGVAGVAHATVYRVDEFKITESHFDFGDGRLHDVSGRPTDDGRLDWVMNTAGVWEPTLVGRIWINNARDECVRVQMMVEYDNGFIETYTDTSSDFCAPNGQTWFDDVNFRPVASQYVHAVTIKLQCAESSGDPWVTAGLSARYVEP
jgi:hypothetical protein